MCLFADIIFYAPKIKKLITNKKKNILLAIRKKKILKDTMRVKIKNKQIFEIGNQVKPKEADGNFLGVAKFSAKGSRILKKYLGKNKDNFKDYYTEVFNKMINDSIIEINYMDIKNMFWKEVDTNKDYNILKTLKNLN